MQLKFFQKLDDTFHEKYMRLALAEAERGAETEEVPAGCIIVKLPVSDNETPQIIGKAHNMTETLKDPTAHAEILAITQAADAIKDWRIADTILYVTKEPCPMCGGAIVLSRIPYVVWAVSDPKRGAETVFGIFSHSAVNHHPIIRSDILREPCLQILQRFFKLRRGRPAVSRPKQRKT